MNSPLSNFRMQENPFKAFVCRNLKSGAPDFDNFLLITYEVISVNSNKIDIWEFRDLEIPWDGRFITDLHFAPLYFDPWETAK